MKRGLKLFLWTDDWTSGVMLALAKDVEQARKLIVAERWRGRPDLRLTPLEDHLARYRRFHDDPSEKPFASILWCDLEREPEVIEKEFAFFLQGGSQ